MVKAWFPIKARLRLGQHGFSPVEVLLAATVFGFLVTAMIGAIVYGRQSTASAGDRARAVALADESVQAVRNIRDAAYTNLADGTYGLTQSGNQWVLSGTSDTSGIYTRQITIAANGTNRKAVTATVTWSSGGSGTRQVSTNAILSNWMATIIPPASWTNTTLAGSLDAASTNDGLKVATAGNYAYVVRNDGTPDFMVVNISNPAAPSLVGSLSLTGAPANITVSGNYAYVASTNTAGELAIVNISNPAAPSLTGTYNAPGTAAATSVFVNGTTAYLTRVASTTTGTNEFLIINASNPASPTLTGSYNNNVGMQGVYVSGNYAFVPTDSNTAEVMVINITTPTAPTLATSLDLSGTNNALTAAGFGTTLLVGQAAVLYTINIATPTSPAVLDSVTATGSGTINDITLDNTNSYAFIATAATAAEFQVINIAAPNNISVADTVDLAGTTSTLNGVAYSPTVDVVAGTGIANTQEIVIFKKN